MSHNFRTMYNSLTPSLRKSDEQYVAFPPPPPRIPAHPPRLLAEFPPPVPPRARPANIAKVSALTGWKGEVEGITD